MGMDIQEQIRRYEEIDAKVGNLKEDVQREKMELDYAKKDLKDKMKTLKEKGLDFKNVSDLESQILVFKKDLTEILDATERKLNEVE